MSFYKMIDDRAELARRLEAVLTDHAETAARSLAELFASLSEGITQEEWYENELLRQQRLARWIGALRREMVAAGDAHYDEERRLEVLRGHREDLRKALYEELVEVRRQARCHYTDRATRILGIRGRTHRKPRPLARQARLAIHCLEEPTEEWREIPGFEARRRGWLKSLEPLRNELDAAIEAVVHGHRKSQVTLETKQRTMKTFDGHFGRAGRYVIATYELIGRHDLAALVPPRVARKDRRKSRQQLSRPAERSQSPKKERSTAMAKVIDLRRWIERKLASFTTDPRRRRATGR